MNYAEAKRLHGKARDPQKGKPIANNTRIVRVNNTHASRDGSYVPAYAIRFHATNVVTFYADGSLELNSGGWKTRSTADRMSMAEQVSVFGHYSRRGEYEDALFAKIGKGWHVGLDSAVVVHDGLTLTCDPGVGYEWDNERETYGEWHARYEAERRERARERRQEQRERVLRTALCPRGKYGWYATHAGNLVLANGVLFSGENPVAIIYPATVADERMRALTVVSERAWLRTKVAPELVESANRAGHTVQFAPHETVLAETQNRTGALNA